MKVGALLLRTSYILNFEPRTPAARGRGGKICSFEIRHLGILSVLYLQQMLPKLPFLALWEFHYSKFSSGPNHGGPFH